MLSSGSLITGRGYRAKGWIKASPLWIDRYRHAGTRPVVMEFIEFMASRESRSVDLQRQCGHHRT